MNTKIHCDTCQDRQWLWAPTDEHLEGSVPPLDDERDENGEGKYPCPDCADPEKEALDIINNKMTSSNLLEYCYRQGLPHNAGKSDDHLRSVILNFVGKDYSEFICSWKDVCFIG